MKESHDIIQMENWNRFVNDGDDEALSKIYVENFDLLYNYGKRITLNNQYIEDAIQDTFISIIKYKESIGVLRNLRGYIVSSF